MKIIFLIDNLRKGGKERRMLELIKGLSKTDNIDFEIVIFKDQIEYDIVQELNLKVHIIKRKPKYSPNSFFKLYSICNQFKPDIIHSWSTMCSIFAIPTSQLLNIKLVNGNIAKAPLNLNMLHTDFALAKFSFIFSDIIIGNSSAGLKSYKAPLSKSMAIKNGFDFKRLKNLKDPNFIKKKYNITTELIIAKVAAFADRKDYDTYIAAAQLILSNRKDVTFLAIGNGPNLDKIKNSIPKTFLKHIIFTGAIQDIESLISTIDVGILSTNDSVHGEGISNSILEYMALSKPVIATKGGGTDEIVVDQQTGYLIPSKAPQIMADKIIELINNPELSKKMGLEGSERIKQHFNLDHMTTTYLDVYTKLLQKNK
ncbi:glycosyltransferase [Zobellia uliginosa]|uniref:glycosyltransferase n=1 Tax=Zobellia uliginosa TaxID=143224 RepID=UPI001C068191|nr:glycosyltransferase [Zobellia uliginosa]MBU2948028.1 glycosyltransferase [Zobellia uliginosa]